MLRPGETREWVDEGQLSKERTQSKVAEVLRSAGELDCSNAYIRLRESGKSEDKAETSVESSIPSSHGGRALVVKGTEEAKNAEANSKYQAVIEKALGVKRRQ
ncbi:hypothetical protein BHE74_00033128, partial [Ensete ventricosum]